MPPDGLVVLSSDYGAEETVEKITNAVAAHGMAVMAVIDHAAAAAKSGMTLRPTKLLLFGNPKAGTPLMQAAQTMGIDLPLKALVWQDADGRTWLGYNDPKWLAARHCLGAEHEPALARMRAALDAVAQEEIHRTD